MSYSNDGQAGSGESGDQAIYVKLRGLPYTASDKDVNTFFAEKGWSFRN